MSADDRDYMIERHHKRQAVEDGNLHRSKFNLVAAQPPFDASCRDVHPPASSYRGVAAVAGVLVLAAAITYQSGRESAPPFDLPENGSSHLFRAAESKSAPFKIVSNKSHPELNYLVRVSDWTTGAPLLNLFVRGGQEAEVPLSPGTYRITYGQGTTWYGPEKLFGRGMVVSEGITPTRLYQSGPSQMTGVIITLTGQFNGNYPTKPGNKSAFD